MAQLVDQNFILAVVKFLGGHRSEVVKGLVGSLGIEQVHPVQGLELDVLDPAQGPSGRPSAVLRW